MTGAQPAGFVGWPEGSVRRFVEAAAEFTIPESGDIERSRQARTALLLAWLGTAFAGGTAVIYVVVGSAHSGAALGAVTVALVMAHHGLARGRSPVAIGNLVTAICWLATFVVASRTGGLASPAVAWSLLHPVTTYVACGRRSAIVWAVLSCAQIVVFYVLDRLGVAFAQDVSAPVESALRLTGFVGCILANVAVLGAVEGVRRRSQDAADQANRVIDRQRILGDMHDGVGSQLLGLLMQARAGQIDRQRLEHDLASCLDDLKLIVDSLDPAERSFDLAVAELHARLRPRFEAANVELLWEQRSGDLSPEATLQVLRIIQEASNNALRHGRPSVVSVLVGQGEAGGPFVVDVRDDGVGFGGPEPVRRGRGLASLEARSRRLNGRLVVEAASPGVRVLVEFALPV